MSRGEEKPLDDLLPHFCSRSPYPFPRHPGGGRGSGKLFFSSCSPCASIKQGIILPTHPSLRRSAKSSPNQTSFLLTKDFSPFCYTYIQLIFIDKIRIPSDCPQISQLMTEVGLRSQKLGMNFCQAQRFGAKGSYLWAHENVFVFMSFKIRRMPF